ncbi:MAG: ParB/RepB/Spo0J family partition protein [Thaumarchaeota archaeon]|nr:ParB/RepB/Spo0J family partition protein [Nitrososphaerota archaeon]
MERISDRNLRPRSRDDGHVEGMVRSLAKYGLLHPVCVRKISEEDEKYEIVYGSCRLAAARKLGWKEIEAKVIRATDIDSLILALIENDHRKDFTDYERALLLEQLHKMTKTPYYEVAEMVGKSAAFVSQHVAMLHLFPDSVASEEEKRKVLYALTEGHARALLKIEDVHERWNTAKLAIKAGLGVRELEKHCTRLSEKRTQIGVRGKNVTVEKIVSDLIEGLNSKDLRPIYRFRSTNRFSLFSRFPPFHKLTGDTANDHIFRIIRQMTYFKVKLEDLEVIYHGGVAIAIMSLVYDMNVGGKSMKTTTRATLILFNEDNEWKIIHEHWSSASDDLPLMSALELREKRGQRGSSNYVPNE